MTLTPEQQRALDQLLAHVPSEFRRESGNPGENSGEPVSPHLNGHAQAGLDLLQTWLGVSGRDLKSRLKVLLAEKDRLEVRFLDWSEANPLDAAFEFILGSAYAFYLAEKEQNQKINTYVDSLYYIATCASVGYADIFAVTQAGKTIAALVMLIGPALTNQALVRPRK
jgi:hypothetical protein